MEKVRPWCGQPLDRARLTNRTEQISPLPVLCAAGILCLWLVCLCVRMSYGHAQQRHSPTGLPSSSSYSIITPHDRGAEYCEQCVCLSVCLSICVCLCVCLSAIISSTLHVRSSPYFLCVLPMAVARFFSGGVMLHFVSLLPGLWMTSYLLISQGCSTSPPS